MQRKKMCNQADKSLISLFLEGQRSWIMYMQMNANWSMFALSKKKITISRPEKAILNLNVVKLLISGVFLLEQINQ